MTPTLEVGDIVVANGLAYKLKEPQRGDIIIFDMNGVTLIKRVIGVPGDSLMFVDGYLYLNGELVSEEYLPENIETNSFKDFEDIPDECYFVMGDNAIKNGATSVLEPELEPWGQRTCYIADPEGNLIEIGSWNMSYEEKDLQLLAYYIVGQKEKTGFGGLIMVLETAQLLLREYTLADIDVLFEILSDAETS